MSVVSELRRRNVIRSAIAYAAAAWLMIQVVETLFPIFGLGATAIRAVVILVVAGFVPATIVAWAFELTPEGLRRDSEVDRDSPAGRQMSKRLDGFIMITLALAVSYFTYDKFVLAPQREAAALQAAREAGRTEVLIESYGSKSIAVLPFTDLSVEQDQTYFADGIAEELLNLLARIRGLRVISRSSAFALRDAGLTVPELAHKLDVRYILEGSLRKAGNRARVTAQLIDGRSDTHIWSETYDFTLDDVFAIQDKISAQVVQELEIRLLGNLPVAHPTDLGAYDLYLQGRFALSQRGEENLLEAEKLFQQAIDLDPEYGPAHAALAKALVLQAAFAITDPQVARRRAAAASERALELNPHDSDALAASGLLIENTDPETARKLYEQAIESNPNNSDAYRWLGLSYSRSSRPDKYLENVRRGYLTDPMSQGMNFNYVMALERFGRYDEALGIARAWRDRFPGSPFPYKQASDVQQSAGNIDLALKGFIRAYQLAPGQGPMPVVIAWMMLDWLADDELAEAWLDEAMQVDPDNPFAAMLSIVLPYGRGEQARAVQLLAEAEQRHPDQWVLLGRLHVIVSRDYARAIEVWERGMTRSGESSPENWEPHRIVDYALALQHTGAQDRANELIDVALRRLQAQIDAGFVQTISAGQKYHFYVAALYALRGDFPRVMAALRDDAALGGVSCFGCLTGWPHFDRVREEPEFVAFFDEQSTRVDATRQRLAADGVLVGPQEALALNIGDEDIFTWHAN